MINFWLLLVLTILASCGYSDAQTEREMAVQGTGQGNGLVRYQSKFGLTVDYAKVLTLKEKGETFFSLTNENLLNENESPSKIKFSILDSKEHFGRVIKNEQDLKESVHDIKPEHIWDSITFNGARGLFWEKRTNNEVFSEYYLFTINKQILYVELSAFSEGQGLKLVDPVIHTLSYDVTPPQIIALRLPSAVVQTGSILEMDFKARDNVSGVSPFLRTCWALTLVGETRANSTDLFICGDIKVLGDDWYRLSGRINAFAPAGTYQLRSVSVSDIAKNQTHIRINKKATYFNETLGTQTKIRILSVKVENSGIVDTQAPIVQELRASGKWSAGNTAYLEIKVREDLSGVSDTVCFSFHQKNFERNYLGFYCRTLENLGDNIYRVAIPIGPFQKPGTYVLGRLDVKDKAGNNSYILLSKGRYYTDPNLMRPYKLRVFEQEITNTVGPIDTQAPKLLGLRLSNLPWRAGKKAVVEYKAVDDISGYIGSGGFFFCPIKGCQFERAIHVGTQIKAIGGGWYRMEGSIGKYLPEATYVLEHYSLVDVAGNSSLTFQRGDHYEDTTDPELDPDLPVIRVRVHR